MVNPLPFMGYHGIAAGQDGISQMGLGMAIAASMVVLTMFQQFLLNHFQGYVRRLLRKLFKSLDPNVQIKFANDDSSGPKIHEAYGALETYLSSKCSDQAPRLKASFVRDIKTPVLGLDLGEGVEDKFNGVTVRWQLGEEEETEPSFRGSRKNRYYTLSFQKSDRKTVVGEYLRHVMEEGKALVTSNRQLKLYSNNSSKYGSNWKCMMDFNHPAKFETLAMEQGKKQEIIDDLMRFSAGREHYRRIGKPWKRGYLLHGPPGTGKTTMIAAMANFLSYDVYYLELTAVCSNDTLKHLLNQIPCNSILVIEDIDCSSNITNKRERNSQCEEKKEQIMETVTLSGLLNCIDGLFSANDGGMLMVFTTNHVKAIDSALLRRGRMDKHIEMPYCGFEAFKVLAKNYLGIEEHELFGKIEGLLKETRVSPADVAENLIAWSGKGEDCGDDCLKKLIEALEENIRQALEKIQKEGEGNGEEIELEPSCTSRSEKITSNGHL